MIILAPKIVIFIGYNRQISCVRRNLTYNCDTGVGHVKKQTDIAFQSHVMLIKRLC